VRFVALWELAIKLGDYCLQNKRMHLTEVTNKQTAKDFIRVNVEINKDDPNYIRPLDKDINETFDPKKNKTFRFGEAARWILKSKDGKLIGRIAAFTNKI
jgi:hypothetical protein